MTLGMCISRHLLSYKTSAITDSPLIIVSLLQPSVNPTRGRIMKHTPKSDVAKPKP